MSEIRRATPADVPALHALAETWTLKGEADAETAEAGFLVSNFEPETYRTFTQQATAFYVLEHEGEIEAFLLAYGGDQINASDRVSSKIHDIEPRPFLLIKQICVRRPPRMRGAAHALYDHLAQAHPGLPQYAAIVIEPRNTRSIRFHERRGFVCCYEIEGSDGLRRGMWMKEPE